MATPNPASLLGLPPELRDEIWKWTIAMDAADFWAHTSSTVRIHRSPALLPTNRQIRHEALQLYFKQTFEVLGRRGSYLRGTKSWMRVHAPAVPVNQIVKMQIPVPAGEYVQPDYVRRPAAIARRQLEDYGCDLEGSARFVVKVVQDVKKVLDVVGVVAPDLYEIVQSMVGKARDAEGCQGYG